jgi:hypothetical protein
MEDVTQAMAAMMDDNIRLVVCVISFLNPLNYALRMSQLELTKLISIFEIADETCFTRNPYGWIFYFVILRFVGS